MDIGLYLFYEQLDQGGPTSCNVTFYFSFHCIQHAYFYLNITMVRNNKWTHLNG